jgi:hypothetical protein
MTVTPSKPVEFRHASKEDLVVLYNSLLLILGKIELDKPDQALKSSIRTVYTLLNSIHQEIKTR